MTDTASIDELAAEFVLGVLPSRERAAVTQRLQNDKQLAAAVAAWERRLLPLSHREPGVAPPPNALAGILARIAQQAVVDRESEGVIALRHKTIARRRFGAAIAATAAVLAVALGILLKERLSLEPASLLAVIERQTNNPAADEPEIATGPVFLATMNARSKTLAIRQIAGPRPPLGRSYAVWLTEHGSAGARLLGILTRAERALSVDLSMHAHQDLSGHGLAVSLESGASVHAPTGPVIAIGKLEKVAQ